MKKLACLILVTLLIAGAALAETVFVSVSTEAGKLAVASEAFEVKDADGDGVVSISDALFAAHEAKFDGGAAAGYEAGDVGYGISLLKLWGVENGGAFSYYVNNASAFSLADAVADGDHVYAYAFTDLETWSDTYSYFDISRAVNSGDLALTLNAVAFDADFNPVATPVEGAIITIDGEDTEFITDANGAVTIALGDAEEYLISARSESMMLVPPVCIVTGNAR